MTGNETKGEDKEIKELLIRLGNNLTDREQIDMLSEIYSLEDQKFSKLLLIDELLNLGSISKWVRTILTLRVSKGRKGRKEIIQVLKNLQPDTNGKGKTSMSLKRIFMGEEED